jgi:acetoin utilization deacetylase AcuC-like enzyme
MENQVKIFFDPRQSVTENDSFSPSAQKPALVVESWKQLGIPLEFPDFEACSREQIKRVHNPEYVDGVLDCTVYNGFGNRSPQVAAALPWVCGSMVAAALHALQNKVNTFSPTSGAHHARYQGGGAFCTFNFLALAAVLALKAGARRVGIVDCDMHHGDGTEDILKKLKLKNVLHYSFANEGRVSGNQGADFIDEFSAHLQRFKKCDLILFNAGADPHIDDPLGGVLTTDEMRSRDFILFLTMKEFGIPVATSLAGGYQRDEEGGIGPVLELHNNTLIECHRVQEEY